MGYQRSFRESVGPAGLRVLVRSEANPQLTVPNLRRPMAPGRFRALTLQLGESPPACAIGGGWNRLHCLYMHRLTLSGAHPAGSINPPGNPVLPRRAIADHRGTGLRDVPAARIRR